MRRLLFLLLGLVVLGLPASASAQGACPNEALRGELGSSGLADCRAYEMVSPVDKGGINVAAAPSRSRAATDGNAVQYVALGAFPGASGTDAIGSEYVSVRGSEGWSTHGITPPQTPATLPTWTSMYEGDFSSDLSKGVFYALSPVDSEDPKVAEVPNLYLRDDLLSPGAGHYRLLSGCPACSSPLEPPPVFETFPFLSKVATLAGASEDFSHVLFESPENLVEGAEGTEVKLYESVNGVTRLAGVLPDSACGTPPCVASASVAGRAASQLIASEHTSDAISRDGSRIIFTAPPFTELLAMEGMPLYGGGRAGSLYLREDGTRTVQLNASERSPAEAPQPAYFAAASADASKIFFLTRERLTEDDTDGHTVLYMYDVDAPAGHHLSLLTPSPTVGIYPVTYVVGVSSDGEYVYFYSGGGPLLSGQATVSGSQQLYVWHHGELRFIGAGNGEGGADVSWGLHSVSPGAMTSQARVSRDGKYIAFVTNNPGMAQALGYDNGNPSCTNGGCEEVYLYSYDSDSVSCVSCDSSGFTPLGGSLIAPPSSKDATRYTTTQHLANALSEDGNVLFNSPDALVPQDINGKYDVYEYMAATGAVRLISSGQSSSESLFEEATPDGHDVFFVTGQRLVGSDVDEGVDLYDARVDGGITAQRGGVAVSECSGDLCQGSASGGPSLAAPSSLTFTGAGNLSAPAPSVPTTKNKSKVTKKKVKKRKAKIRKKAKVKKKVGSKKRRGARRAEAGRARTSQMTATNGR